MGFTNKMGTVNNSGGVTLQVIIGVLLAIIVGWPMLGILVWYLMVGDVGLTPLLVLKYVSLPFVVAVLVSALVYIISRRRFPYVFRAHVVTLVVIVALVALFLMWFFVLPRHLLTIM